jgi:hypothetical protein
MLRFYYRSTKMQCRSETKKPGDLAEDFRGKTAVERVFFRDNANRGRP